MQVVEAIAQAIRAEGTEMVFCLPDEVTIHVAQAIKDVGLRVVRSRHEQNAVAMADGYARATGQPAVCVFGEGPALAQIGTALMTAARRRSPLVVLFPQGELARGNVKEFDARRFVESVGGRFMQVRAPAYLGEDIHEAFRLARTRRGPVALAVPSLTGLQTDIAGRWAYVPTIGVAMPPVELDPTSDLVNDVAGVLASVRKPVIVVGRGAIAAARDIELLADRVGAVLATSLQARELFRGHPRNIGVIGTFGTSLAAEFIAEADCILALGIALNVYQTGGGSVATNARVIHVDQDPAVIGTYVDVDTAIVADAGAVARALHRALEAAGIRGEGAWADDPRFLDAIPTSGVAPHDASESADRVSSRSILRRLDELLPSERVVIVDTGSFVLDTLDAISISDPNSWVWTADFGSIGLGLGVALGTSLARPDDYCVLFAGDGGFSMNMQELETAAREHISLTIVILNDCAYQPEVRYMEDLGKSSELARFDEVDFAAIAHAFGIPSQTVIDTKSLDMAIELLRRRDGPVLLDAKVSGSARHRSFPTSGET